MEAVDFLEDFLAFLLKNVVLSGELINSCLDFVEFIDKFGCLAG